MKGLVCILLLLETFVFVVQQQVDGGINENEIRQQISSEDGRQNPPQTDTSTDHQQYCHLCFPDIHAALRELTATVSEQRANNRALETRLGELTATVTEQRANNRALEMRLGDAEKTAEQQTLILEEMNKKNDEISNLKSQVEELRKGNRDREIAFSAALVQPGSGHVGPVTSEITLTYRNVLSNIGNAYNPITGIFTAPLKGAYMFRVSVYGYDGTRSAASIIKNGERVVTAYDNRPQNDLNASNGVVLVLEVGDAVYVRLWSNSRLYDSNNNHNTFSGYLLFPLREPEPCRM